MNFDELCKDVISKISNQNKYDSYSFIKIIPIDLKIGKSKIALFNLKDCKKYSSNIFFSVTVRCY